jgi:hypothetical protein
MSKKNFVCFRCRAAVRREAHSDEEVRCPECGKDCQNIGYKTPVPQKSKPEAWKRLHEQFFREQRGTLEQKDVSEVHRKQALEQEIAKLEDRPENNGRTKEIRRLRRQLEAFDA